MYRFTLRQLEYLVAVADEGSISAAAQRLHVTPGGISLALDGLEKALQIQLLIRRRAKGISLTPAGRIAADRALAILEGAGELQGTAEILRGELFGPLRIGCFSTLSPWMLPRIVEHFTRAYPGVYVEMEEGPSDELQSQLQRGEIDACIMYSNHITGGLDGRIGGLAWEEIVPVRVRLLLPPTHRLAQMHAVALRDLNDEPAVLLALQPTRQLLIEMFQRAGLTANVRWRTTSVETIRSMVARGLAWSVIMGRPAGDRTYDGLSLIYKEIADDVPSNVVVVAYPEGTVPTAKVRALIDFCKYEFADEGQPVQ